MRIIVTGSSGKLGQVTVDTLRKRGHIVSGVDIIPSRTTDFILDIRNYQHVLSLTKGYDAIIHTAALHGRHMDLKYTREDFIETNITGTLNLLNACVYNSIKRFLFTSTTSIYGNAMIDTEKAVWVTEELPILPRDIYDITKQCCEELCKDFFDKEGIITSVYRVGRFLPESINLMLNHRLYRGLDERDGAQALALAVEYNFNTFEIFNISSGSPFDIDDLVLLKKNPTQVLINKMPKIIDIYKSNSWELPSTIDRVYVCDKAKTILGYIPKYTFDYMINNNNDCIS